MPIDGTVQATGEFAPSSTGDTYAILDTKYLRGGLKHVDNISDLDTITSDRRETGMVVSVSGGTLYYKLNPEPWSYTFSDWTQFISDDIYVTGATLSTGYTLTLERNDNVGVTVNLAGLASDVYVISGVYDNITGVVTFTNSTGGTFNVSGFTTGMTEYWISGSSGNYSIKANNDSGLDATGNYAVAEGYDTRAIGLASHAEGLLTTAQGGSSHSEGGQTTAIGDFSHAEGNITIASWKAFTVTGVTDGVITLDSIYSGVTGEFYGNTVILDSKLYTYNNVVFTGSSTEIFLDDTSVNSGNYVADMVNLNSSYANNTLGHISHAEGYFTQALGEISHAEGRETKAIGDFSHAEGVGSQSFGLGSHAEGNGSQSFGLGSHAEGIGTKSNGQFSHAEGFETVSSGDGGHAEGKQTTTSGDYSHAEGIGTTANGNYSHSEGNYTLASGENSHAEGWFTTSIGTNSHAEGNLTVAGWKAFNVISVVNGVITLDSSYSDVTVEFYGTTVILDDKIYTYNAVTFTGTSTEIFLDDTSVNSGGYVADLLNLNSSHANVILGFANHAEGVGSKSLGLYSHAEGFSTTASGNHSHAEGNYTIASGEAGHAEGQQTTAIGQNSHAEGYLTTAAGESSHSEGNSTTAIGFGSHAEGYLTIASGDYTHSEGRNTTAQGKNSHAEGQYTTASGLASHAEGSLTIAQGENSHSEGWLTTAQGNFSHAGGSGSIASGNISFVHGNNSVAIGDNTIVLGANITGNTNDTLYVDFLNIKNLYSGSSVYGLGIDANGNVVSNTSDIYSAGIISASTIWSNNSGEIDLPAVKVALFDNPNNLGSTNVYDIASGTTGSGGINSLIDNDTNYIMVDYNSGSPIYVASNSNGAVNGSDVVLAYIVYRLGTFIHVLDFGEYGAGLPNRLNERVIATQRFARESGLILGLSAATGVVLINSGVAWNGPNRQSLVGVNSQDDIFFKNFHSGGTWTYTTTGDTLNNTYYDNGTDIVSASASTYLVNYYYRGQEINDHIYEVYGNNEYTSVLEAEAASEPTLPELITSHAFLVGRIIVKVGETTGITQTAFGTVFQPSGYASGFHNDLLGIQGGAPGENYHLSFTEYDNLGLSTTGASFDSPTLYFDTIDSLSAYTVDLTPLIFTGNTSGNCITDLFVTNINSCSPLHIQNVSNGNVLIGENGDVNVGIGTASPTAKLEIKSNSSTGDTMYPFAVTNSSGSNVLYLSNQNYYSNPNNLGVYSYIYDNQFNIELAGSSGQFKLNRGVNKFWMNPYPNSLGINLLVESYIGGGGAAEAGIRHVFSGGSTFGTIYGESLYVGTDSSTGSTTIVGKYIAKNGFTNPNATFYPLIALDGNIGFGTSTPSEKLEVVGKTKTTTLQITSGATAGYVLTATDTNGNSTWSPASGITGVGNVFKYTITTGFTASVTQTITHNLNTKFVHCSVWDSVTNELITAQVVRNTGSPLNALDITISTSGTYDILITG